MAPALVAPAPSGEIQTATGMSLAPKRVRISWVVVTIPPGVSRVMRRRSNPSFCALLKPDVR